MISQHSFSVVPEGNPLRRRWTVTAEWTWVREEVRAYWVALCDGNYVHDDMGLYDTPQLFEEHEALAVAEQAAGCVNEGTAKLLDAFTAYAEEQLAVLDDPAVKRAMSAAGMPGNA